MQFRSSHERVELREVNTDKQKRCIEGEADSAQREVCVMRVRQCIEVTVRKEKEADNSTSHSVYTVDPGAYTEETHVQGHPRCHG